MAKFDLTNLSEVASPAPEVMKETFFKPVPGEIEGTCCRFAVISNFTRDCLSPLGVPLIGRNPLPTALSSFFTDVVQAHPDDKKARPHQWQTWRFEVVLATDDPDVQVRLEEEKHNRRKHDGCHHQQEEHRSSAPSSHDDSS